MSDSFFERVSPRLDEIGGASWEAIGAYIVWCITAQVVLYGICMVVNAFFWDGIAERFPKFIRKYVGVKEDPPTDNRVETFLRWVQFSSSLATVCFWVYKTYRFRVSMPVYLLELLFCGFYICAFLLELMRYEFLPAHMWSFNATLDIWTTIPLLLQKGGGPACQTICPGPCWISFSYLRCMRVLLVWTEIEGSGALDNVTEFARGVITTIIKFLVIVVLFSGTMFIFETLGDIEGFTDRTMETEMGHTSFLALCYFTFVTISTVGYGDFSPMTVLGRLFVIIVILGGVAFFSIETGRMMNIMKMSASGKGRFTPRNPRARHVLVIGGGVNGPISVLESFLRSLVDPSHGDKIPEVVLMGPKGPDEDMVTLLAQRWATRANIKYLWGNCAQRADLQRARIQQVEMCYVLADVNARAAQEEDLQNIIRGAAVYRMFSTPLLVMMLEAKNVKVAVQTGIPERMCAGLDDLEISTIASSAQCVGLSTIVINLALPDLKEPEEYADCDRWLEEYIDGANKELYGLQLKSLYHHKTFTQAAKDVYNDCGVMLIACQDDSGSVVMNPGNQFIIKPTTVFFCIADDEDALVSVRSGEGRDWLESYEETRAKVADLRLRDQRKLAASHERPALLALEPEERGVQEEEEEEKKKGAGAAQRGGGHTHPHPRNTTPHKKMPSDQAITMPGKLNLRGQLNSRGLKSMRGRQSEPEPESPPAINLEQLFDEQEHVEDEGLLKTIVDEGNHIVVVGLTSSLFPQLVSIMRQLRHKTYPKALLQTPIIILYTENLTHHPNIQRFLHSYPRVIYVRGSPLKLRSLITAGVDRCSRLLMVANGSQDPKTSEPIMMDQEAILLLSVLESQRSLWGRLPDVICELQVPSNIRQLDETYEEAPPARPDPFSPDASFAERGGGGGGSRQSLPITYSSQFNRTHARYATGGIILRAEFSSLFAAAYYTSGVLDLLKSMTQPPSNPAASIVWKVPATMAMLNQTFESVFAELVEKEAIPIGLCRAPSKQLGNQLSWVYTCPAPDTTIQPGDSVYLLASAEWVEKNKEYTRDLTGSYTPGRATRDSPSPSNDHTPLPLTRRCPQGHELKGMLTPKEGWGCDVCLASDVPQGTAMQGCKRCRWVCCLNCFAHPTPIGTPAPTNHFSTRHVPPGSGPHTNARRPSHQSLESDARSRGSAPPSKEGSRLGSADGSRAGSEARGPLRRYESDNGTLHRPPPPELDSPLSHSRPARVLGGGGASVDGSALSRHDSVASEHTRTPSSASYRPPNPNPTAQSQPSSGLPGLMSDLGNLLDVRKLVPQPASR